MNIQSITFVSCILFAHSYAKIPSYIKPCSISAPNFEKCCLEHGKEALPRILKGDRKFGIPNMIPLLIPQINVNAGQGLRIFLKDVQVHGLDTTELIKVKIDTKAQKLSIRIKIPELKLLGKYDIEGKILVLRIEGNGDFNIVAFNGEYEYNANFLLHNIGGEDFFDLADKDTLDFVVKDLKVHLDNLFNGDKALGDQMNKFLNENWEAVIKEFGPAISETVRSIGRSIASAIFKRIPYHQLILD
ncbi:protein takeout isoform X2 [Diabrotica virgifera virgifera]|uniref:Protein takeout-like n=1 Tax=Diabrotica virgifera virgifera TaxID=50390 RepID=A0ABM5KT70_DIAVI|nr:protein takeout isoform X2 [Diabrotica virgifera virgifera]